MLYVLFRNRKKPVPAEVELIKQGVVRISPVDSIPDNLHGFFLYLDSEMSHKIGDYSAYTTRYKETDDGGMYMSNGEVYVEPSPPAEPEQDPEPTPEEIEEKERQEQIAEKQMQIDILKAQLTSTDYIYTKKVEADTVGEAIEEYDFSALHDERQACRDRINALEEEIAELRKEGDIWKNQ